MRKVLSFVLVLALVLGSFSMAFAATPTDVVGTPNADAVQVLMGLNVVNGYTDGTFKPAGIVTRAEMAKLIVVALGLGDYATGTSKFTDMAGAAWAQGYVNYAAGLGIIKGYPDGTFKPSQTVSYTEAAAMIVRGLGYTDASLLPATWPANYVVKAKSLDIFKDVNKAVTAGATRGDIAQMIYNTLDKAIGSIDKDGVWVASTTDTMLNRLSATQQDKAVVLGNEDSVINLGSHVGAFAQTYLNSDDKVITVKDSSTFLTGKWAKVATDGTFTAGGTDYNAPLTTGTQPLYYYKTDAAKAADTRTTAVAFYNGNVTTAAIAAVDSTFTLGVKLSGLTIKEVYSISKWTATKADLFTADEAQNIIDDKALLGVGFAQDDSNAIDLNSFQLFGAASLKDIKVDNVVYVYAKDSNSKIKRVEVGTAVVTGQVTKVSSDAAMKDKKVTIGGKEYKISTAVNAITSAPVVGDTGTAKLDYSGKIFDWSVDSGTSGNYAIVIATAAATGIDSARVKLLTKTGDTTTFDVDSDAMTVASFAAIKTGDLVEFSTDKAGVIDTFTKDTLLSLTTPTAIVSDSGKVVNGKSIDSAVVIFTTTSTTTPATATYDIGTIGDIAGQTLNYAKYFSVDAGIIDVMLVLNNDAVGTTDNYAVINNSSIALNAAGDKVKLLEGFYNGKALANYTDKETTTSIVPAFATPTLYKLNINGDGVVTSVSAAITNAALTTETPVIGVTLTGKDGNLIKSGTDSGIQWYTVASNAVVYQLNVTDGNYTLKTFSSVSTGDIVTMWQADKDSDGYDIIVITKI